MERFARESVPNQDEVEEKESSSDDFESPKLGYQTFENGKKGLHHPTSEYENAPEVKREYGVKIIEGEKRYQLFYICPDCGNKDKHFVPKGMVYVNCHECGKRMKTRTADHRGLPNKRRI